MENDDTKVGLKLGFLGSLLKQFPPKAAIPADEVKVSNETKKTSKAIIPAENASTRAKTPSAGRQSDQDAVKEWVN